MATTVLAATSSHTLGVLELGTNSLKLHLYSQELERFEPSRVEWEVGFEVYSAGRLSEDTIGEILEQVRQLLQQHGLGNRKDLFGIATGVFPDAENSGELLER